MTINRWQQKGLMLLTLFFFLCFLIPDDAFARAGGGRSSSGSRGSRSYSAPASPSSPSPTSPSGAMSSPTSPASPMPQPAPQGGFLRSMAGGVLGGLVGGMLFRSLGFGAPGDGTGGGIGLFEILLIAGILYFIYRFVKRRREQATATAYYQDASAGSSTASPGFGSAFSGGGQQEDAQRGISHIRQMDAGFDDKRFTDACMDAFFKIQGAWANRDMSSAKDVLTDEMNGILSKDVAALKAEKKINHLENIAVRTVDITEAWQESGQDFITVRFLANLLDYTTDESGNVVSGSKADPVKFEEYWTFTRPVGSGSWKLSAIQQAQ